MILSTIPSNFIGGVIYIFEENYLLFFEGIKYTLLISLLGTGIGLFISFFVTLPRVTKNEHSSFLKKYLAKLLSFLSTSYVEFLRGTPMMVQAAIFYYGLSSLGVNLPIIVAGLIVVSLNTSAYLSEVLRSGINAIDKGQFEAGKALGLSNFEVLRYIVFPQAIKNMIPAIGNELVVNIKDTAVLSVIGVSELFYMGKSVAGTYYRYTESFFIVALLYLVLVLFTTRILSFILKRLNRTTNSMPSSVTNEVTYG